MSVDLSSAAAQLKQQVVQQIERLQPMRSSCLVGVEFNAPLDTIWVISEAVFTANHLTDTEKQNSTGKYR